MDDPLDAALRQHLRIEPEPADEGFSDRLLAALPRQPRVARTSPYAAWVQRARWTAMGLAGAGLALVTTIGGRPDDAGTAAACAFIGLLAFWSLPWRWSGA